MPNFMADLDYLQALAALVDQAVNEVQQNAPSPTFVFNVLEAGWQGQSRQDFDQAYKDFHHLNVHFVSIAQQLSQHLRQEIMLLEEIQRSSSISFAP